MITNEQVQTQVDVYATRIVEVLHDMGLTAKIMRGIAGGKDGHIDSLILVTDEPLTQTALLAFKYVTGLRAIRNEEGQLMVGIKCSESLLSSSSSSS